MNERTSSADGGAHQGTYDDDDVRIRAHIAAARDALAVQFSANFWTEHENDTQEEYAHAVRFEYSDNEIRTCIARGWDGGWTGFVRSLDAPVASQSAKNGAD